MVEIYRRHGPGVRHCLGAAAAAESHQPRNAFRYHRPAGARPVVLRLAPEMVPGVLPGGDDYQFPPWPANGRRAVDVFFPGRPHADRLGVALARKGPVALETHARRPIALALRPPDPPL